MDDIVQLLRRGVVEDITPNNGLVRIETHDISAGYFYIFDLQPIAFFKEKDVPKDEPITD